MRLGLLTLSPHITTHSCQPRSTVWVEASQET
jgi:hypothetical protein